jgi:hypothetical protein
MCAMVGGQPAAEVERHSENDRGGTFAPAQTIDGEFFDGLEIYIDRRRVPRQR